MFLPNSYSQKSISKQNLAISEELGTKGSLHKNSFVLHSKEDPIPDGFLFGNSFLNNLSGTNKYNIKAKSKNNSGILKGSDFINNSSFDYIFGLQPDNNAYLAKGDLETPSKTK